MEDIPNIPGVKQALKGDNDLKKYGKLLGKKIQIPGVEPVEIGKGGLKKNIKNLENLQKAGSKRITELQDQLIAIEGRIDEASVVNNEAEAKRLLSEYQTLQGQISQIAPSLQKPKEAIRVLKKAQKKVKNVAILLGAAYFTGGAAYKIAPIRKLILNYGTTIVYILLILSGLILLLVCLIVPLLISGNVTTQLQTAADAAGTCSLNDQACIGELYLKNAVENGTANVQ